MNLLARSYPVVLILILILILILASPARGWIHDQDANRIDDRIEDVNENGWNAVFYDHDPSQRMRISAFGTTPVRFGVNVGYDHAPTVGDETVLASTGVTRVRRYLYIDYIRCEATFDQITQLATLPGVTRVEAIQRLYPTNHVGTRVLRARDSRGFVKLQNGVLFPSARQELGLDGTGLVVAIMDTGVNDAPDAVNPLFLGHESLRGKFLGGGEFFYGDPLLDTPNTGSINPQDHGSDASQYHGTHVAGTAIGTGGDGGVFAGMAPGARLVDCKLLTDLGASAGGAALGVEWCIFNMDNDWGLTGPDTIYAGIDVLNLSLGGDSSDGTDADAQSLNAAVQAGLVVVAASGNLGVIGPGIASPASADDAITVGASTHAKTLDRSDDLVASFSQTGPRADDGDLDALDEMKPNVVAPGFGIISADGDYTGDGRQYKILSGTSMATPHVAGAAALLLQADPSLTPLEVRSILQNTAFHGIGVEFGSQQQDPFGIDSNYRTGCGWGVVDVYAAAKEVANSTSDVQVVRIRAVARPQDGAIDVLWWTQREYSFLGFDVYRAPDVNGAPGSFVQINTLPVPPSPEGDPVLVDDDNRVPYVFEDTDPGLVVGTTYWYRIAWLDAGGSHLEPFVSVDFGELARVATVYYSIVHNFADSDLSVRLGTSSLYDPDTAEFITFGSGTADQDSFRLLTPGVPFYTPYANVEHFWSIPFSEVDGVTPFLHPSQARPWFVEMTEGGFADQSGIGATFSMFVNDAPGNTTGTEYVTDTPTPQPLVEGQATTFWIPENQPIGVALSDVQAVPELQGIRIVAWLQQVEPGLRVDIHRGDTDDLTTSTRLSEASSTGDGRFEYLDVTVEPGRWVYYWVVARKPGDPPVVGGPLRTQSGPSGRTCTFLEAASPNPMVGSSTFRYGIGRDATGRGPVRARLEIHDPRGRLVRTLVDEPKTTGHFWTRWDGRNESGQIVARGVYYARFSVAGIQRSRKLIVLRD